MHTRKMLRYESQQRKMDKVEHTDLGRKQKMTSVASLKLKSDFCEGKAYVKARSLELLTIQVSRFSP